MRGIEGEPFSWIAERGQISERTGGGIVVCGITQYISSTSRPLKASGTSRRG